MENMSQSSIYMEVFVWSMKQRGIESGRGCAYISDLNNMQLRDIKIFQ